MCYGVTALLTIRMKRLCALIAMPNYGIYKTYYKYSTISKECDIYHQRYHVWFFHVCFHVYTYDTAHLNAFWNSGKAAPRQRRNTLILVLICTGIRKIFQKRPLCTLTNL